MCKGLRSTETFVIKKKNRKEAANIIKLKQCTLIIIWQYMKWPKEREYFVIILSGSKLFCKSFVGQILFSLPVYSHNNYFYRVTYLYILKFLLIRKELD